MIDLFLGAPKLFGGAGKNTKKKLPPKEFDVTMYLNPDHDRASRDDCVNFDMMGLNFNRIIAPGVICGGPLDGENIYSMPSFGEDRCVWFLLLLSRVP